MNLAIAIRRVYELRAYDFNFFLYKLMQSQTKSQRLRRSSVGYETVRYRPAYGNRNLDIVWEVEE